MNNWKPVECFDVISDKLCKQINVIKIDDSFSFFYGDENGFHSDFHIDLDSDYVTIKIKLSESNLVSERGILDSSYIFISDDNMKCQAKYVLRLI